MNLPKFSNGSLDNPAAMVNAVIICNGFSTKRCNFGNNRVGSLSRLAVTLESAAKVIYEDIGTLAGKVETIRLS